MEELKKAISCYLQKIPEMPEEALENTPRRFVSALEEMLSGYKVDIDSLFKEFGDEGKDQLNVVAGIPFCSLCAHHLLPFHGVANVGYIPVDKVLGLSKIPRLVDAFSRRLTSQERLTKRIACEIQNRLQPLGTAVVIQARHLCLEARGAKSPAMFVTSEVLGTFREDVNLRNEFFSLIEKSKKA